MHLDADVHAPSQRQRPGIRTHNADVLVPVQRLLSETQSKLFAGCFTRLCISQGVPSTSPAQCKPQQSALQPRQCLPVPCSSQPTHEQRIDSSGTRGCA